MHTYKSFPSYLVYCSLFRVMQPLSTSPSYKNLWNKMTRYAVEPALRNQIAGGTRGTRRNRRRTSRSLRARGHAVGGGTKSNGAAFLKAWTESISNQVKRNVHKQKRSHRRSGGAPRRGRSTKQKGGFIRGGSVQYFPPDEICRAQANRVARTH